MKGPRKLQARPTCAVCQTPVEEFTEEDLTGTLAGRVAFVARCHGSVDRIVVWKHQTRGLNFGTAFSDPTRLSAPRPRGLIGGS
jgi:hypothetical protein